MCVKRKVINQYSVDTNFTALISMTNVAVTSPTSEKKKTSLGFLAPIFFSSKENLNYICTKWYCAEWIHSIEIYIFLMLITTKIDREKVIRKKSLVNSVTFSIQ